MNSKAFITKNPCLLPSDVRIVNCISSETIKKRLVLLGYPEDSFEEFINAIVFPQKGEYPLSAMISGGDLDGDYYLLCWDPDLMPKKV